MQTLQAVTAADGSYHFADVAPGDYQVSAAVNLPGFSYTSDSDGAADWHVAVQVASAAVSQAMFAGIGKGTLQGSVFTSSSGAPIKNAPVVCRWAGFDDIMNTADDVLLDSMTGAQGQFGLQGVPYGAFSCTGTDPVTGAVSPAVTTSVLSAVPVTARLPITGGHVRTAHSLASTGTPTLPLLAVGSLLLLAGVIVLRLGLRNRSLASQT